MLIEYVNFMSQYADMAQKMEDIEDKQQTAADEAYYLEVSVRIYKKLAEAMQ